MSDVLARTAESFTADLARRLVAIRRGECVLCYTLRMVDDLGCTGTARFAMRWLEYHRHSRPNVGRDLRADGVACDCTLLLLVWTLRADLLEWSPLLGVHDWPQTSPPCEGATPGQGCSAWVRQRREC